MNNHIFKKVVFIVSLLLVLSSTKLLAFGYFNSSSFLLTKAYAASEKYSAQLTSVEPASPSASDRPSRDGNRGEPTNLVLTPNQEVSLTLKYKNTGTVTWQKDIFNFTAISTAEPLMHESNYAAKSWETKFRPTKINEKAIKPGQVGSFTFKLKAPAKEGKYSESFILVVRRISWIDNSQTKINFEVKKSAAQNNSAVNQSGQTTVKREAFIDPTPEQMAKLRAELDLHYAKQRQLAVAASEAQIESSDSTNPPAVQSTNFTNLGPIIRVGLYDTNEPIEVNATYRFSVKWANADLVSEINAGAKVILSYNTASQLYKVVLPNGEERQNTSWPTLSSTEANIVFKILNYDNRLSWNPSVNDNRFRNKLELRYSQATGKTWVINELPMEYYVKGVSEVSNQSPQEYLKAMAVAIRTYAYYHYNKGVMYLVPDGSTKHANEHFHVDSLYDQVYRGYGIEERLTNFNQAVSDTRGLIVKYENKVAITPYFSRSDGRTRSFAEVWNNDVPWLVSVPTAYDQGNSLYGHGVGMDCTDAYRWADNNNGEYQQILKYYYTGVEINNQY